MQKEINQILGKRIKNLRKMNNLTREELAERISVSTRFLADLESGKVGVSISTLKIIAQKLNTSADYLIGLTDQNETDLLREAIISKVKSFSDKQLPELEKIIDGICSLSQK